MKKVLVAFMVMLSLCACSGTTQYSHEDILDHASNQLYAFLDNEHSYVGEKTASQLKNNSYLGNELIAYELDDNSIKPFDSYRIFPIFCDNEVIAMYKTSSENLNGSTDDEYVEFLNQILKQDEDSFYIVFAGGNTFFLKSDGDFLIQKGKSIMTEYQAEQTGKQIEKLVHENKNTIKTNQKPKPMDKIKPIPPS